jgi:hypothetical protein
MKANEDEDYYFLPDGRLVMTATYLLKRGWCCGNGCLHCPFDYINVKEPKRTTLLAARKASKDAPGT